jgi:hypothetical protein
VADELRFEETEAQNAKQCAQNGTCKDSAQSRHFSTEIDLLCLSRLVLITSRHDSARQLTEQEQETHCRKIKRELRGTWIPQTPSSGSKHANRETQPLINPSWNFVTKTNLASGVALDLEECLEFLENLGCVASEPAS